MRFKLMDRVLERDGERLRAIKLVSMAEEYLADHFESFPVLPGVFMLEALVQTARALEAEDGVTEPRVIGRVRALKYGALVRPGDRLWLEVERRPGEGPVREFKAKAQVSHPKADGSFSEPVTAASGRFELRPLETA